jgi:hypothetical protein
VSANCLHCPRTMSKSVEGSLHPPLPEAAVALRDRSSVTTRKSSAASDCCQFVSRPPIPECRTWLDIFLRRCSRWIDHSLVNRNCDYLRSYPSDDEDMSSGAQCRSAFRFMSSTTSCRATRLATDPRVCGDSANILVPSCGWRVGR